MKETTQYDWAYRHGNIKLELKRFLLFCVGLKLVVYTERGTYAEGVREQGAEEDIWA